MKTDEEKKIAEVLSALDGEVCQAWAWFGAESICGEPRSSPVHTGKIPEGHTVRIWISHDFVGKDG